MYHTMTFLFNIFLCHSWLCDSTKGGIVVRSLRKVEKMGWRERYKLLFPLFTRVSIPVQLPVHLVKTSLYRCRMDLTTKYINYMCIVVHLSSTITKYKGLWIDLNPWKHFGIHCNSMNAFLTLLTKIEKVNSSLKVSDFLVL